MTTVLDPTVSTKPIKCVVWDLDDTLWHGSILECTQVVLREEIGSVIRTLDERGILQSIASKNDHDVAWNQLQSFGLSEYFLYPQIGWGGKAESVREISQRLGISIDAIGFVDDRVEERDEVAHFHPKVTIFDASDLAGLLCHHRLNPSVITDDGRTRRKMYRSEMLRTQAEESFEGGREGFLRTLGMRMSVVAATSEDLSRIEELTLRTNQLNTTGRTYSREELEALISSPNHSLLVAKLEDRYGTYGTVGLTLIEKDGSSWTIRLFIMSCRVMTRGVGTVLLGFLIRSGKDAGVRLLADFVHTDRNRQMYMTYKFAGFKQLVGDSLLQHDFARINPLPDYIELNKT